jgi:hypothetical protein
VEADTPPDQPVCVCVQGALSNLCPIHAPLVPVQHDGRPLTAADVGPLIAKELG